MIVLDIETYQDLPDAPVFKLEDQKLSYAGIINYETGEETDIWENDLEKCKKSLMETDLIIGYNIIYFDIPVLARYLGNELNNLPMLDLMVAANKAIGFRPKLNNLSNATLGEGKLGSGKDAGKYYREGNFDFLKKYCLEDVRLTLELYRYGLKYGTIKYYDRNGFPKETKIDWTTGYKNYVVSSSSLPVVPRSKVEEPETLSLF